MKYNYTFYIIDKIVIEIQPSYTYNFETVFLFKFIYFHYHVNRFTQRNVKTEHVKLPQKVYIFTSNSAYITSFLYFHCVYLKMIHFQTCFYCYWNQLQCHHRQWRKFYVSFCYGPVSHRNLVAIVGRGRQYVFCYVQNQMTMKTRFELMIRQCPK